MLFVLRMVGRTALVNGAIVAPPGRVSLLAAAVEMSVPCVTFIRMGVGVTEEALLRAFTEEGIVVIETTKGMEGDQLGWYSLKQGIVAIWPDLMQHQRVAVLLHEWFHHARGDDGHQDEAVERKINELVAKELIDPVDYAWCESQFGWSTGGIAAELGVPTWIVKAYRRHMNKNRGRANTSSV